MSGVMSLASEMNGGNLFLVRLRISDAKNKCRVFPTLKRKMNGGNIRLRMTLKISGVSDAFYF